MDIEQLQTEPIRVKRFSLWRLLREVLQTAVTVVLTIFLLNLLVPRYEVQGSSMEPNFHSAERLLGSPLAYAFGNPERGDIIVFQRGDTGDTLIKRVIGLPGETVYMNEGRVWVNGLLLDEPYVTAYCKSRACSDRHWQLDHDQYFVLGDNRPVSIDSHNFGPIQRDQIMSKVLLRWWPLQDVSLIFE